MDENVQQAGPVPQTPAPNAEGRTTVNQSSAASRPGPTIDPDRPPFPNRPSLEHIVQEGTVPTITRQVRE